EADQQLLAEHAPRFAGAQFHPVSPRMFEQASGAPNEQAAGMLRQKSGIAELQQRVQEVLVGKAAMHGEANSLRTLSSLFDEQYAKLQAESRALSAGEQELQQLRTRREELQSQRRSSTKSWQVRLRSEVQRARIDMNHEAGSRTREAQAHFRKQIEAAKRNELDELPSQVDAALQTLSERVAGMLAQRLNRIAESVLADLYAAEALQLVRAQLARDGGPRVSLQAPEKRPPTAEDKLLVFMGVSGGFGAGKLAAMSLASAAGGSLLSPIVLPAPTVIGLGPGRRGGGGRGQGADQQPPRRLRVEARTEAG